MILPIVIDTQDLMTQFTSLDAASVNRMLDNIAKGLAASFAQKLEKNAEKELHKTRQRYIHNIKVIDSGKLEGTVMLDYSKDKLVKMIEEGAAPFDMKQYFLASPKAKIGKKGGKYLTIPYRQGVPTTIGESDNFAFIMTKEVYAIVKKKPLEIQTPGYGMRSAGLSLKELPQHLQVRQKRAPIQDSAGNMLFKEYQHKNAINQGIAKYVDAATGQSSYRSFRRVSENSDEEAWIHPGIEKYNLVQKTLQQFDTTNTMSNLLDDELNKLGLL
jgi:hypothetical protein